IDSLLVKVQSGDVSACGAYTSAVRELNAISALHSQTVNTGAIEAPKLTQEQAAAARAAAEAVTKAGPRLAQG
ncbi:unnamed protein product, partial [marine sediment metagenome]